MFVIPALRMWRQKDQEFKDRLNCILKKILSQKHKQYILKFTNVYHII